MQSKTGKQISGPPSLKERVTEVISSQNPPHAEGGTSTSELVSNQLREGRGSRRISPRQQDGSSVRDEGQTRTRDGHSVRTPFHSQAHNVTNYKLNGISNTRSFVSDLCSCPVAVGSFFASMTILEGLGISGMKQRFQEVDVGLGPDQD
jgi:hypothetical protein